MTCDDKDRHVLQVAVGTKATHLVTTSIRDFWSGLVPRAWQS
ncbi:MAG: hypothetical protein ABI873_14115 [Marmoricola sp.]